MKKTQNDGSGRVKFLLGNQFAFANHGKASRARTVEANKHGSWWAEPMTREEFSAKVAEVFPDMQATKEGQRPFRPWKSNAM